MVASPHSIFCTVYVCSCEEQLRRAGSSAIPVSPILLEGCSVKLSMYPGRLKVPESPPGPPSYLYCANVLHKLLCIGSTQKHRADTLVPQAPGCGHMTRGEGGTPCRTCLATSGLSPGRGGSQGALRMLSSTSWEFALGVSREGSGDLWLHCFCWRGGPRVQRSLPFPTTPAS